MDGDRFDEIVQRLSRLTTRRGATGLLAALLGEHSAAEVGAKPRRKAGKRDANRRQATAEAECTGTGGPCGEDGECCSGRCSDDERGDPPARRCCQAKGKPCKRHSQCCSGRCQDERCVAAPGRKRGTDPTRNRDAAGELDQDPSAADPDAGAEPEPAAKEPAASTEPQDPDRPAERVRAASETGCPPCTACHYDSSTGDGGCDGTCADPCLANTLRMQAVKNKTYKKLDAFLRNRGFGEAGEAEASTFTENGTLDSQSLSVAYGTEAAIVYTRVGRKGWAYAVTETAGETRVYVAGKKGKIEQLPAPVVLPEGASPAAMADGGGRAETRSVSAAGLAQNVLCTDVIKKPEIKDLNKPGLQSRVPFVDVGGPTTACEWLCGKIVKFVVCQEGSLVRKLVKKASIAARCARVHPLYGPPTCVLVETILCDMKVLSKVSCPGICGRLDCPECGLTSQWLTGCGEREVCCDGKCLWDFCSASPEQISPANPVDPCASCAANHTCCHGRCCAPGEGCYNGRCERAGACGCRAEAEICCEGRCCYWDEKCCGRTCCGADDHCCGDACCGRGSTCCAGACCDPDRGEKCVNGTCVLDPCAACTGQEECLGGRCVKEADLVECSRCGRDQKWCERCEEAPSKPGWGICWDTCNEADPCAVCSWCNDEYPPQSYTCPPEGGYTCMRMCGGFISFANGNAVNGEGECGCCPGYCR
jgi:hypothetical protein